MQMPFCRSYYAPVFMLFISAKNVSINGIVHNSSLDLFHSGLYNYKESDQYFHKIIIKILKCPLDSHVSGLIMVGNNAEHILQSKKSVPSEDSDQSALQ